MYVPVCRGDRAFELRSRWDVPETAAVRVEVTDARRVAAQLLRECRRDSLRALLAPLRPLRQSLEEQLAEALRRGDIALWRRRGRVISGGGGGGPGDEAELLHDVGAQKTWIEIELLDMDGNPMPGERYLVKLPDGTERRGTLDAQGRAYFGGLDPGEAEIIWESRDGDATELAPELGQPSLTRTAPSSATRTSRHERHWVEIELLDMEGAPVAHERYWIKLPDGTVREGTLDGEGRAFFDDLDEGTCEIRWPFLDGEATGADPDPTVSLATRPTTDPAVSAQVEALVSAAQTGVPFCEECEAARRRDAQSRAQSAPSMERANA